MQVSPEATSVRLLSRESTTIDLTTTVPRSVTGGEFDLTVTFDDETATATVTIPELVDTNLARFGTADASSSASDFPASQAIDGNSDSSDWEQGTGWNDDTKSEFPDWLKVNFPVPLTVNSVEVFTLDSEQLPASEYGLRDYDVQVLVDGEYEPSPRSGIIPAATYAQHSAKSRLKPSGCSSMTQTTVTTPG